MNKKSIIILVPLFAIILVALAAYVIWFWRQTTAFSETAKEMVTVIRSLQKISAERNLSELESNVAIALGKIREARREMRYLNHLRIVPAVNAELSCLLQTMDKGEFLLKTADLALVLSKKSGFNLNKQTSENFANISFSGLKTALTENESKLNELANSEIITTRVPVCSSRIAAVNDYQKIIDSYVAYAREGISSIKYLDKEAFDLLGVGKEKKYLLLFQNVDDLRPGGGLISTYGLVTVKDGKISNLMVDHVTEGLKDFYLEPRFKNPKPVKFFRHQDDMYLYDANWEIDPETWLKRVFYSWNAQMSPVDGVITIATPFFKDLVSLYGPIKIADYSEPIDSERLMETLDFVTEKQNAGYQLLKSVIEDLINDIYATPFDKWPLLADIIGKRVVAKDLLVFSPDQKEARYLEEIGLKNKLPVASENELIIADSGLGSRKSDAKMKRNLQIVTDVGTAKVSSVITLNYDFSEAREDFRTSLYSGYLQIMLPRQNIFREFLNGDLVDHEINDMASRKSYGNYVSVGFGENKNIYASYGLAEDAVAGITKSGKYEFTLRKQTGLELPYFIYINVPSEWQPTAEVSSGEVQINGTQVVWKGILDKDSKITVIKGKK